ncbi:hypothetical protein T06_6800 [Trichinella sp. T6]|nr:hypothetical protein T06_6800 [Trichinella sp. T6]
MRLYDLRPEGSGKFHGNPNLLNKRHLKNVFRITVRYSLKLRSVVQYFFVLGKSIFLHFLSIWNKFIEIVSARFKMPLKSSIY